MTDSRYIEMNKVSDVVAKTNTTESKKNISTAEEKKTENESSSSFSWLPAFVMGGDVAPATEVNKADSEPLQTPKKTITIAPLTNPKDETKSDALSPTDSSTPGTGGVIDNAFYSAWRTVYTPRSDNEVPLQQISI